MKNKLKIQLITLLLIVGASNLYGAENNEYIGEPNYSKYIAEKDLNNSTYKEPKAYKYFGKTLDELNKKKGINSDYFLKASLNEYDSISEVVGIEDKDEFQVYFGNNNTLNNFKVLGENEFKGKLEKDKEIKYNFKGYYEILDNASDLLTPTNSLGITVEEYKERVEGKKENEIFQFIKEKMISKNIDFIEKNGELFSKDSSGKEWKIYYTIPEAYTKSTSTTGSTEVKFEDKIYQYIFLYTDDKNNMLYTKDNSIYIHNPNLKTFYLVGKGKIDGEIDLGGEDKSLYIETTVPSRYGKNIIFGENVRLKNISKIVVGQDDTGSKNSSEEGELGGLNLNPTTLTFDLDPNLVNDKGHLYKHVLSNTDEETRNKIQFKAPGSDPYTINLMVSKVNEDKTVDMMKKNL